MAITRSQQAKQMLQDGGMLVKPGFGGTRQGYRGDAAARSTGAAQSGRADPGSRGDPGEGRATTAGVSEATGGFAPTRGVSANVGPTGRDDLVQQSLLNQAKEFRKQQQEKRKGLNLFERFRVNNLKKQFELEKLKNQNKFSPIVGLIAKNLKAPELSVYESTSEDDIMDTDYGMSGEDLTRADRLADAINKAEKTGNITQGEFESAFFGPGGKPTVDDKDGLQDPCKGPNPPAYCFVGIRSVKPEEEKIEETFTPNLRLLAGGGMAERAPYEGGIMDLESARQMYGLGKLVKKVTRTVKKIAKSPIGKAAILGAGAYYGLNAFPAFAGLSPLKRAGIIAGGLLTLSPFFMKQKQEDIIPEEGADIDDPQTIMANAFKYQNIRTMAEGGSTEKEPVAKKTMPLLDMGGMEKDYREDGGFVPIGRMEKADDVPARLSKNEFVFTADAVRNAGDGNVDKGAEVMYNMMKNLEAGGEVSEESQGLKGAREMFQTSQRLGEVV